jgi:hypothetical protein
MGMNPPDDGEMLNWRLTQLTVDEYPPGKIDNVYWNL